MIGDLIKDLNTNGAAVTAAATVVLVLVTTYYAWQNRRMASEMKQAREAQVLPALRAALAPFAPGVATIRVTNVGPGAAIDVRVSIILERPGSGHPDWAREWRAPVVVSGESADFFPFPTAGEDDEMMKVDAITSQFPYLRLSGTYRDLLDTTHRVDHSVAIAEWWRHVGESHQKWVRDSAADTASAVGKIATTLEREATQRRLEAMMRDRPAPIPNEEAEP